MRSVIKVLAACVGLALSLCPAAASAATPPDPSLLVTVAGTPVLPYAFAGVSEYDRTNITSQLVVARADGINITVGGGTRHRTFDITVQPPSGQSLHAGTYLGDGVDPHGSAAIGEGSETCQWARFRIADLAYSGTTITRLDLQFQTYCGGYISSTDGTLFGEVSFGEPAQVGGVATGARSFVWPDIPVGADTPVVVPMWVRNTSGSPVSVGKVTRTGTNAGDFRLTADGCSGHTLAAHAGCSVGVVFHPTAGTTRTARLVVPLNGRTLTTTLTGVGSPGTTFLRMTSPPGEWVGDGRSYDIPNAKEQLRVATTGPERFVGEVGDQHGPENWTVAITAPAGKTITPGTYSAPRTGSGWTLVVSGDGRGCGDSTGKVTITQAAFGVDNAPTAFRATFVQTCTGPGTTGSLTGEIAYHATA